MWKAAIVLAAATLTVGAGAQQADAVGRQALIGALTGNDAIVHEAYVAAQRQAVPDGGIPPADAIAYLYNCTRQNREEFLAGQEILVANAKDKDWRNRVMMSLLSDEVYELNRLEGQNRFNKYTRIFNRVSTSLSQLVLLQPQAAASLMWDGINGFKKDKKATVKERKMVYLSDQFLKKYPSAPERDEVIALRAQLKNKMLDDRAKALTLAGKTALSTGKFQRAEWNLEKAALLNPSDAETSQLLAQARTLRVRSEEMMSLTLGVSDAEAKMTKAQQEAVGEIARALLNGKTNVMMESRQKVPSVWDSVDYGFAAIEERRDNHDRALSRLQAIAQAAPNSAGGMASTKLLDNPNYNLSESYQKALADMASEQTKFIWTGRRTRDENVYAGGSAIISNAANPVAVPVLFGLDAAVRAISEKFKTQVSVDGVLDAGARYRKKYPDSPQSKQIAQQLAALSKKAGDYKRSMTYLEDSGTGSADDIAKLKENQAKVLYEQLKRSGSLLEKRQILEKLTKDYADATIVRKNAAKEQAKLPPSLTTDTIVIPTKAIQKEAQLARYLGVADVLVDGSKGNGEIDDGGICITPSAEVTEFRLKGEDTWRRVALARDGREWILTSADALRSAYLKTAGTNAEFYRQRLPFAVEGGVGSGGVDLAPKGLLYPTSDRDKTRFE